MQRPREISVRQRPTKGLGPMRGKLGSRREGGRCPRGGAVMGEQNPESEWSQRLRETRAESKRPRRS